jgi:MFS transporter, PAT family, beta-lactamase induction signal transducer AmpG
MTPNPQASAAPVASAAPIARSARNPWAWIPTLYFGQGMPYVVVMTLSVIMYKNLDVSNTDIALYTSWLYLPWVIKPLWSPLVDMFRTKRFFIVALQGLVGVSLALVALTIPTTHFFQMTLAMFWLMAFASATHDIAADGFYMLALPQHQQAAFVGVRSTFYRISNIACQGALVWLVGRVGEAHGSISFAWTIAFFVMAVWFLMLFIYHFFMLPKPASDHAVAAGTDVFSQFMITFASYFKRPDILLVLAFLLTFRLGEAQALKLIAPFLLDPTSKGGLGLTTSQLGIVYGTWGVIALTLGGLLGGFVISRAGLRKWLWPMLFAVHIPNLAFVFLAYTQPTSTVLITAAIVIEQFGYGFGFAAYLLFMIMVSDGPFKTAHYSICTGFMALGMMLPGMISGWIQTKLGYPQFFVWVCICTVPSIIVTLFLKIDPAFGKKKEANAAP